MSRLTDALQSLRPGAGWSLTGDTLDGLEWIDTNTTKPTQAEVDAEIVRLADLALAAQQRRAAFEADAVRADLLTRLRAASPAQISSYVDNNVTNLAEARALFKRILLVLAEV